MPECPEPGDAEFGRGGRRGVVGFVQAFEEERKENVGKERDDGEEEAGECAEADGVFAKGISISWRWWGGQILGFHTSYVCDLLVP